MRIFAKILTLFFLFSLTVFPAFSQAAAKIKSSTIISDINQKKKQTPKMTAQALADYANEVLATKGFNYSFEMSELFFQKTTRKEFPENQKEQIINFPFEFTLINNNKKQFELTAKHNLQNQCYDESSPAFPVTQVTEKQATIIHDGKPVIVKIPKEFGGNSVYLMDSKTKKKVVQKWLFPYNYGISADSLVGFSADGKKIYVTVGDGYNYDYDSQDEIKELALEISADGKLRFVPTASVKKKFTAKYETMGVTNLPVDILLKITVGNKVYYLAVPDMSC
jgi:hypothetical protein